MTSKGYSQFLSNDNLSILFEVIVDEYKNYILDKNNFNIAFNEMVQMFYYSQIKSGIQNIYDIVNMNKKFISFVSKRLEKKFNINKNSTTNPITNPTTNPTTNTSTNLGIEYVTNEDIKNERLEKFDKDLNLKQREFKSAFTNNIPEPPNFKSPIDDPITEIDILTKKKLAERENEIQSIYNNVHFDKKDVDFEKTESNEWLQYFSVPVEKKESNITNIMKSIKIKEEIPKKSSLKEEIVDLHEDSSILKKNISWSDDKIEYNEFQHQNEENKLSGGQFNNIFTKLKKIQNNDENKDQNKDENKGQNKDQKNIILLTSLNETQPSSTINLTSEREYSNSNTNETIVRLESKIDKLTNDINKCYDVITLLFNNIMSSNNISSSNLRNASADTADTADTVDNVIVTSSLNNLSSENANARVRNIMS
jgi:hypothetical protein